MTALTPEQRAEWRRLAGEATPGHWELGEQGPADTNWTVEPRVIVNYCHGCGGAQKPDAAYIAATSPDRVLALLADLERVETALAFVRDAYPGPGGDATVAGDHLEARYRSPHMTRFVRDVQARARAALGGPDAD